MTALAQSIDFADGIVAYYPFNGNALDKTNQGNDGLVNGATLTSDRFGNANAAYQFDGIRQGIRIPYSDDFNFSEKKTYSVSLWMQPRDLNAGCILLKNFDYGIKWNAVEQPVTFYSGIQGGYPNTARKRWNSSVWYHLVLVQEEDRLLFYINGDLDMSLAKKHLTKASKDDLYLGNHPYFWGAFAGKIDDICLYDRAVNEYEVQALYQIQAMPLQVKPRASGPQLDAADLAGVWQGVLTQPANKMVTNYAFWMEIKPSGQRVDGFARIEIDESYAYGVTAISGNIAGDRLSYREERVVEQKNYQGFKWCKKFGRLSLDPTDGSLRGDWYADNCQQGGEIILFRSEAPFNYHDNRLSEFVSIDQLAQRLRAGEKVEQENKVIKLDLENIEYATNKAIINPASQAYLEQTLLPFMQGNAQVHLRVTGHTDNVGDDVYNLSLSQLRAKAVVDFLVSRNIAADRLNFEGYGESRPVADNGTAEGRSLNRRVEFEVSNL
jgi:outer membrane protein OmpA-like peptidoglycan-associated protein